MARRKTIYDKRDTNIDIFRGEHPDTRTNAEWVRYMENVKGIKWSKN